MSLKRKIISGLVFSFIFTILSGFLPAQDSLDILKDRLNDLYGKDKLVALNQVAEQYLGQGDSKNAIKYARDARALADNIITPENKLLNKDDFYLKPLSYLWLGVAHLQQGNYLESKAVLQKSRSDAERWGSTEIVYKADMYLDIISNITGDTTKSKGGVLRKTFRVVGGGFNKTTAELNVNANLKMAEYHEKNQNYNKAIEYYYKAMDLLSNLGKWAEVYELQEHIADLLLQEGKLEEAMIAYDELEERIEEIDDTVTLQRIDRQKELITDKIDSTIIDLQETKSIAKPSITDNKPLNSGDSIIYFLDQASLAEESEDYEQSLYYFKEYMALEKQLNEEKRTQELALLEKVNEIENQDREIKLLKQNEEINALRLEQSEAEIKIQRTFKRNLVVGLILLAALVLALYFLYRTKRRDHRKLGMAYKALETTRDHLANAEKRIKSLLHQQVSGAVANELLASEDEKKIEKRFVCIMFLDIRDFTPFAEKRNPEEIIQYQNLVFGFMIEIVQNNGGIINQILGDGFMATFGAPVSADNDCKQAYVSAKEIINKLEIKTSKGEIPKTKVGIGLHAGYVVTGNVGTDDRKQYSVTGNTVILAARLEQLNKRFNSTLVLSREVYNELPANLKEDLTFTKVNVKGRSEPMEVAAI